MSNEDFTFSDDIIEEELELIQEKFKKGELYEKSTLKLKRKRTHQCKNY